MSRLPEVLRDSARNFLAEAIELELEHFMAQCAQQRDADGQQMVVRNGHHPVRDLVTGIGPVAVRLPKIRSRGQKRVMFRSALVPAYLRRTASLDATSVALRLYLSGIAFRNYGNALAALLGPDCFHIPQALGSAINAYWTSHWDREFKGSLDGESWSELWVDKIPGGVRNKQAYACVLVAIGVDQKGHARLLATRDCSGDVEDDWQELFLDLKARVLALPQHIVVSRKLAGLAQTLAPALFPQADFQLRLESMDDGADTDIEGAFDSFLDTVAGPRCPLRCESAEVCDGAVAIIPCHRSGKECCVRELAGQGHGQPLSPTTSHTPKLTLK